MGESSLLLPFSSQKRELISSLFVLETVDLGGEEERLGTTPTTRTKRRNRISLRSTRSSNPSAKQRDSKLFPNPSSAHQPPLEHLLSSQPPTSQHPQSQLQTSSPLLLPPLPTPLSRSSRSLGSTPSRSTPPSPTRHRPTLLLA